MVKMPQDQILDSKSDSRLIEEENALKPILASEATQAGDVFLLTFKCPDCGDKLFQGFPLSSCSTCGVDFKNREIDISKCKRRLLTGTRRKQLGLRKKLVQSLGDMQDWNCGYCSLDLRENEYHVEHIRPLCVGGSNAIYNLVLSCRDCNLLAGSKVFNSFEAKRDYVLNARKRKRRRIEQGWRDLMGVVA